MNETSNNIPPKADHTVAMTAIISITIVLLTCIAGCTTALITLALNTR